jgi:hypothetical protein
VGISESFELKCDCISRDSEIHLPDFRLSRLLSRICFERFTRNDRRRTRPTLPMGSIGFLSDRKKFFISVKFILQSIDLSQKSAKLFFFSFNFSNVFFFYRERNVCCLFHDRPQTGLNGMYRRVDCFCFLHNFRKNIQKTTAPYVSGPIRFGYLPFGFSLEFFFFSQMYWAQEKYIFGFYASAKKSFYFLLDIKAR